jgi:hypothetical protein
VVATGIGAALILMHRHASAEALDPIVRSRLEWRRFRAKSVSELLVIAGEFAAARQRWDAKLTVDEAAKLAKTPGEWNAIAGAYGRLGYPGNADVARRRAVEALR